MKKLFLASTIFLTTIATNISGMFLYNQDDDYYDQNNDDTTDAPNPSAILNYIKAHEQDINESNISDSDPDANEGSDLEKDQLKVDEPISEPKIAEIDNPKNSDVKEESIQNFLADVHKALNINISFDTELTETTLYIPIHVIKALNEFKILAQEFKIYQKKTPKQQMTYNALLILVKDILYSMGGYNFILTGNTYRLEKAKSKSLDKN
jgi:hypothetical protein